MEGTRSALSIMVATSCMWPFQWKSMTIQIKNSLPQWHQPHSGTHKPHVPLVAIVSDRAAIKDLRRCEKWYWIVLSYILLDHP